MKAPLWLKAFTVFVILGLAVGGVFKAFTTESTVAWIEGMLVSCATTAGLLMFMWRGQKIREGYHQRLDSLFDRGDEMGRSA